MATKQETCYLAVCDGCDTMLETDYIPHYPTPSDAISMATECDWRVVGSKLYCEKCSEGKGVPCTDCDDMVENEGETCAPCQRVERRPINASS